MWVLKVRLSFAAGLCGVPHIHTAWKPVFVLSTCAHESDFLFGCFLLKMVSLTLSVPSFFFSSSRSMSPFLSFSLSLAQYDVIMPVYSDDVMAADNFQMCERDFFFHYTQRSLASNSQITSEWSQFHFGYKQNQLCAVDRLPALCFKKAGYSLTHSVSCLGTVILSLLLGCQATSHLMQPPNK